MYLDECQKSKKSLSYSFVFCLLPCVEGLIFPLMTASCLRKRKPIFFPFIFFFKSKTFFSLYPSAQWMQVGIILALFPLPPTQTTYQFVSKRVAHSNYISPCRRTHGRGHQWAHPNAHRGRGTIGGLTRFPMRHNCFVSPSCKIPLLD